MLEDSGGSGALTYLTSVSSGGAGAVECSGWVAEARSLPGSVSYLSMSGKLHRKIQEERDKSF